MNKIKFYFFTFLITLMPMLHAQNKTMMGTQEVMSLIQDTHWVGTFKVTGLGPITNCFGDIDVYFFPLEIEEFSKGMTTISYRHHAHFDKDKNPICKDIVAKLSPVLVGKCGDHFPYKYNRIENKLVPFRTIIPYEDGNKTVVSSPSCTTFKHQVKRTELPLVKLDLSENQKHLDVEIHYKLDKIFNFKFTYSLDKDEE